MTYRNGGVKITSPTEGLTPRKNFNNETISCVAAGVKGLEMRRAQRKVRQRPPNPLKPAAIRRLLMRQWNYSKVCQ